MHPGSQNHEGSSSNPLLEKYQTTHRFFMYVVDKIKKLLKKDGGHYVIDTIDSPNWTEPPIRGFYTVVGFHAILAFIYTHLAREFFSDPKTLQALAQKMQLDSNQSWNLNIKVIGDPATGQHRSTLKIEITAASSSSVKVAHFAFKISTPYHSQPAQASHKELLLLELKQSKRFAGESVFLKHFSSTLAMKHFDIKSIGHLLREKFAGWISDSSAIYFQLDNWIEGKTLENVFKQINESGFSPERKDALDRKLATQTIIAALEGWKNLKTDNGGLIYDMGVDDVIISDFDDLEELSGITDHNPVVFVDPNAGMEIGDELAMAKALDSFLFSLERGQRSYFSSTKFFTLVLTTLGPEEGRNFLQELAQAFVQGRFPPMRSSILCFGELKDIGQFLGNLNEKGYQAVPSMPLFLKDGLLVTGPNPSENLNQMKVKNRTLERRKDEDKEIKARRVLTQSEVLPDLEESIYFTLQSSGIEGMDELVQLFKTAGVRIQFKALGSKEDEELEQITGSAFSGLVDIENRIIVIDRKLGEYTKAIMVLNFGSFLLRHKSVAYFSETLHYGIEENMAQLQNKFFRKNLWDFLKHPTFPKSDAELMLFLNLLGKRIIFPSNLGESSVNSNIVILAKHSPAKNFTILYQEFVGRGKNIQWQGQITLQSSPKALDFKQLVLKYFKLIKNFFVGSIVITVIFPSLEGLVFNFIVPILKVSLNFPIFRLMIQFLVQLWSVFLSLPLITVVLDFFRMDWVIVFINFLVNLLRNIQINYYLFILKPVINYTLIPAYLALGTLSGWVAFYMVYYVVNHIHKTSRNVWLARLTNPLVVILGGFAVSLYAYFSMLVYSKVIGDFRNPISVALDSVIFLTRNVQSMGGLYTVFNLAFVVGFVGFGVGMGVTFVVLSEIIQKSLKRAGSTLLRFSMTVFTSLVISLTTLAAFPTPKFSIEFLDGGTFGELFRKVLYLMDPNRSIPERTPNKVNQIDVPDNPASILYDFYLKGLIKAPKNFKEKLHNFLYWMGEPKVVAPSWEEALYKLAPFSLARDIGFSVSNLGSIASALGWSTVGFASAHVLAQWVSRAIDLKWSKGILLWRYAEKGDLSLFSRQLIRGMILTAIYLVTLNFLPIPSSVLSHLVSYVIVVFAHGAYNTAVLKGLVPAWLNFTNLSPLPNKEKKIEAEIDLVVKQSLSPLAYASYKTNRAVLQKKSKNEQLPLFLIDLEEQVVEGEDGFDLPQYVEDWVEGLVHSILLHPYEDNQSIPTIGIVLESKHRGKISQLLIEKWNIPEGMVLFTAGTPEDAVKKAKEKNVAIVSVFTKRPQVWGNLAKWIITFMQGEELRIQGQELEMLKGLFQGKLGRVGSELVIPKESLGLEGTENYFRQTIHFNLQA